MKPTPLTTDRRVFLKSLGGFTLATAAGPLLFEGFGTALAGENALFDPLSQQLPAKTPILVQIMLEGGNDWLNTLVPIDDSWYYDGNYGHGPLALAARDTIGLSHVKHYRLHPSLPWLAKRWDRNKDVAFLHGIGELTQQNFSHFDSTKYWQTGGTNLLEPRGWLGRYNDVVRNGSLYSSVSMGSLRLDVVGNSSAALVVRRLQEFKLALAWHDETRFKTGLLGLSTATGPALLQQAAKLISSTDEVTQLMLGAVDETITGGEHSDFADELLNAACLIRSGFPTQTYAVSLGGFDFHDNMLERQANLLATLDDGLSRFFAALQTSPRRKDLFVVITSEFGRQVTANSTGGTDHGQAGMALLIGAGVKRGIWGQAPTLDPGGPGRPNRLSDSLKPNLDFRALYNTVLLRLSKNSTGIGEQVLGGSFPLLPIFKKKKK